MKSEKKRYILYDILLLLFTGILFLIPFAFIILNSFKNRKEAGLMQLALPLEWNITENYTKVIQEQNFMVVRSFINSCIITIGSVLLLIIVGAMAGYVLHRKKSMLTKVLILLFLSGLMIPPSIMPTIWILEFLGIYRTKFAMILVEVALNVSFTIMLYRGYMFSIPKEIEESAFVDGAGKLKLFFGIVLPLLKPVTVTVIVLNAVTIFNDFVNPLYFLPNPENATVQLTLYNYMGKYGSSWNLLFADVVLITIPPLIMFIFFNKQIVSGMTAGAVKG